MKIVKNGLELEERRKIANKNCAVCPICGETRKEEDVFFEQMNSGVRIHEEGIKRNYKIIEKGIFKTKNYQIDTYKCCTCGSSWESEPYEI